MRKTYRILLFALFIFSNSYGQGAWSYVGTFNGGNCDQPFYFTLNDKGYVGGGRTAWNVYKDDLWEYDPIANTWTQKADYGGGAKSAQSAFTINDKAYVGCGLSTTGYHNDFWEYDPATNIWISRAQFAVLPGILLRPLQ